MFQSPKPSQRHLARHSIDFSRNQVDMPPIRDDNSDISMPTSVPTSAHALQIRKLAEAQVKQDGKVIGIGILGSAVGGALLGFLIGFIQDKIAERKRKEEESGYSPSSSDDDEITDEMLEDDLLADIAAGLKKGKMKRSLSYDLFPEKLDVQKMLEDAEFLEFLETMI